MRGEKREGREKDLQSHLAQQRTGCANVQRWRYLETLDYVKTFAPTRMSRTKKREKPPRFVHLAMSTLLLFRRPPDPLHPHANLAAHTSSHLAAAAQERRPVAARGGGTRGSEGKKEKGVELVPLLVSGEDWCGHAVNTVPVIALLAE